MNDKEETTRKFDDQPEWVRYLISKVEGLTTEVSQLRDRLDARDRETKPLKETLEAFRIELRDLREGQETLRKGQDDLREELSQFREEVRVEFRRLNAKILDVLQRHLDVVADISELNRRVSALEAPNN
ncbi:MAG: hypothetical protein AUJ04_08955 [Acidobacteria bacterium 13_1_40CM_3_55_6]|nr:MAG: hypothetical protein AUJ04_08955 [Acidobacteria bacterium 13_1_40CM_3_55_6]PYS62670.1 MAG: hypothetical protein DMF74_12410 [Acidobacteriota bacterium]